MERRHETQIVADLRAPHVARTWMAEQLEPLGVEPEVAESALLLLSELVTNVVTHTDSAPTIGIEVGGDRVLVEVGDSDRRPAAIRDQEAGPLGGWGLRIVDQIASSWGVRPGPDGAKVVWFAIDRPASGPADGDPRPSGP